MTTNISLDAMVAQADWESLTRIETMTSPVPEPRTTGDQRPSIVAKLRAAALITDHSVVCLDAADLIEEMLEALRELLHDAFEDAHPEAVKKAEAAIRKATGAA